MSLYRVYADIAARAARAGVDGAEDLFRLTPHEIALKLQSEAARRGVRVREAMTEEQMKRALLTFGAERGRGDGGSGNAANRI